MGERKEESKEQGRQEKAWLVKSEPASWSWQQHCAEDTACWDGVRNYQAAGNLRAMDLDDPVLFYHSGRQPEIVGLCRVTRRAYLDPSDPSGRFVMVDLKATAQAQHPLSLRTIKARPEFSDIALVRHSRLSVMPIPAAAFAHICSLSQMRAI